MSFSTRTEIHKRDVEDSDVVVFSTICLKQASKIETSDAKQLQINCRFQNLNPPTPGVRIPRTRSDIAACLGATLMTEASNEYYEIFELHILGRPWPVDLNLETRIV